MSLRRADGRWRLSRNLIESLYRYARRVREVSPWRSSGCERRVTWED